MCNTHTQVCYISNKEQGIRASKIECNKKENERIKDIKENKI